MNRQERPPGYLDPSAQARVVAMICTAGHVDHGKTSLVKMMTGCETDRLKEEKERGLTIELGFAPCFLGGDLCVGIVDVPGHERFIRNMVAGVSGIDLAVLVVAADDGVMPQTVEHVQIMELLGVRQGIVALTKIDLVAEERVTSRATEIGAFLEGTALAGSPVFPVSAVTGEGFAAFYEELTSRLRGLGRRSREGLFRMPVERVFRREGHGAVLSGIPVAGAVRVGDVVECIPSGRRGRVRGIQCFLRAAQEGGAGQCLALNMPDFGKSPPQRGDVLTAPGILDAVRYVHVRVSVVPGIESGLSHGAEVAWHAGTCETPARAYLLHGDELPPGTAGLATIGLDQATAVAPGDRFILRRPSPAWTVAGGTVLETVAGERRPRRKDVAQRLERLDAVVREHGFDTEASYAGRIAVWLDVEPSSAVTGAELARRLVISPDAVRPVLDGMAAAGRVLGIEGDLWVSASRFADGLADARARVNTAVASGRLDLPRADLRSGLAVPAALAVRIETELEREGIVRIDGDRVVLAGMAARLDAGERVLADRLAELYEASRYRTPRPDELPALLGCEASLLDPLLEHLVNEGRLVRVADAVLFGRAAYDEAQAFVVETARSKGLISSQEVRDRMDTSRKYAVALLEFLDRRRVTMRMGNDRKLLPGYERGLL